MLTDKYHLECSQTLPVVEYFEQKGLPCFSKMNNGGGFSLYVVAPTDRVVKSFGDVGVMMPEYFEKKKVNYKFKGFGDVDVVNKDNRGGYAKSYNIEIESVPITLEFANEIFVKESHSENLVD
jgi:hypothetical protein